MIELAEIVLDQSSPRVAGAALEQPVKIGQELGNILPLLGWVIGTERAVPRIRVHCQGMLLRTLEVSMPRPEVGANYPGTEWANTSGFWGHLISAELPEQFELCGNIEYPDGSSDRLFTIRGRRTLPAATFQPQIQPLIVTSLGRTGTTWLLRVLAEHPAIVAHRAYPYETRAISYWMHMFRVLSQPAVLPRPEADLTLRNAFAVSQPSFFFSDLADGLGPASKWLQSDYAAGIQHFCQQSIESFYCAIAKQQYQDVPTYFLEKFLPDSLTLMVRNLYPASRELILTRDFRDTLCSIYAFNAKRGFEGFGRADVTSDEQFVHRLRAGAAGLLQAIRERPTKLVRYEDLILRPEATLREVLDYAGLDSSASVIDLMLERASFDTEELQGHRTSSDLSASIGRWQEEMSPELKGICREVLGPILEELGYPLDPPKERAVAPVRPPHKMTGAPILVVSRGDELILRRVSRSNPTWHFPRNAEGEFAGYYPATSEDAIAHLESLRELGAEWLYFPPPSVWWMDYYVGFREYLETHYAIVPPPKTGGRMFHLKPAVPAAVAAGEKE